jgi:KipI family sensor histidine kinase inhibitor
MVYKTPIFHPMGDRALLVELGNVINPTVNQNVQKLFTCLDLQPSQGIIELVPSYRSLLVIYDPLTISMSDLKRKIIDLYEKMGQFPLPSPKSIQIPVVYGGEYGPDLEWVAAYHHLSKEDIISFHSQPIYRVYMIGFTPGYPYLGEVVDDIVTPRRKTPRTSVPKGSVGIAQKQTGIYTIDSPGGWQIIGWTPISLFEPQRQPPSLLMMGDQVQFYAITAEKASQWQH